MNIKKKLFLYCGCCVIVVGLFVSVYVEFGYGNHGYTFSWQGGVSGTYHNLSAVRGRAMADHDVLCDVPNDGPACTQAWCASYPFGNPIWEYGANVGGYACVDYDLTSPYVDTTLLDYGEICVYCHTPHAASDTFSEGPIWNRTINTGNYSPYTQSPTLDSIPAGRPGWPSIACLSCHDGTIAIDSIININGSGAGHGDGVAREYTSRAGGMGFDFGTTTCLTCHVDSPTHGGSAAIDNRKLYFDVYYLSTDLTNDHPIGMQYANHPDGPLFDRKFVQPDKTNSSTGRKKLWWFDEDGTNYADDGEVKLWGQNSTVECASCHNPHGTLADLDTDGQVDDVIRPFLRKENGVSQLCRTCHIK